MSVIRPGSRIGNWVVGDKIGEGSMGIVYAVQHSLLQTRRALKVIRPEWSKDKEQIVRFLREAFAVGTIHDPRVISVFDAGFAEEQRDGTRVREAYFLMEYLVGGATLAQWMKDRAVDWQTAVAIGDQLCAGLGASHRAGIVHRDLKPANIYIKDVDDDLQITIFDFGLAKLNDPATANHLNLAVTLPPIAETAGFIGTPVYAAPEQARGEASFGADVYATGAILYELVTGQASIVFPRRLDGQIGDMVKIIESQQPKPVRSLAADCPVWFAELIEQCLEKKPSKRPDSIDELRQRLVVGRLAPPESGEIDARSLFSSFVATNRLPARGPMLPGKLPRIVGDQKLPDRLQVSTVVGHAQANHAPATDARHGPAPGSSTLEPQPSPKPAPPAPPQLMPRAEPSASSTAITAPRGVSLVSAAVIALGACAVTGIVVYVATRAPAAARIEPLHIDARPASKRDPALAARLAPFLGTWELVGDPTTSFTIAYDDQLVVTGMLRGNPFDTEAVWNDDHVTARWRKPGLGEVDERFSWIEQGGKPFLSSLLGKDGQVKEMRQFRKVTSTQSP